MLNAKTPWQEQLEDYAYFCVRQMETFARKEWGYTDDWAIDVSVRFRAPRRSSKGKVVKTSSWGGVKFSRKQGGRLPYVIIQLGTMRAAETTRSFSFAEYDHINDDPVIGKLTSHNKWKGYVAALCAHEVAHVIQHTANIDVPQDANSWLHELKDDREGHGKYWQEIYRVLRVTFVNGAALLDMPEDAKLKRPRKKVLKGKTIGRVFINWGRYRNVPVYGNFPLVKGWQAKKEYYRNWDSERQKYVRQRLIDFGEGKNGFVTIYLEKRAKVIRVSCNRDDVKEILDKNG